MCFEIPQRQLPGHSIGPGRGREREKGGEAVFQEKRQLSSALQSVLGQRARSSRDQRLLLAQHRQRGGGDVGGCDPGLRQLLRLQQPRNEARTRHAGSTAGGIHWAWPAASMQQLQAGLRASTQAHEHNAGSFLLLPHPPTRPSTHLCAVLDVAVREGHGAELEAAVHQALQAQELQGGRQAEGQAEGRTRGNGGRVRSPQAGAGG